MKTFKEWINDNPKCLPTREEAWNASAENSAEEIARLRNAAPEVEHGPVEIDWPEYNAEAMGCGMEDHMITDPYEAMRYGWDEALEYCASRLPSQVFAFPPDAQAEIAKRDDLVERLRQEAQIHAQEARTANATIAEIYQAISESTGEPGNWNGAKPVKEYIKQQADWVAKEVADAQLRAENERLKAELAKCHAAFVAM